jgi:hypothetical protein
VDLEGGVGVVRADGILGGITVFVALRRAARSARNDESEESDRPEGSVMARHVSTCMQPAYRSAHAKNLRKSSRLDRR